jgi:hypothetical protein
MSTTAEDCPNCYTDNDDETDCPHLLSGDDCPNCGHELHKPRAGKVECERCFHVVNARTTDEELRLYDLTAREASRLLDLFGYRRQKNASGAGNELGKLCNEYDIEPEELNDVLADLRGEGRYASSTGGDDGE